MKLVALVVFAVVAPAAVALAASGCSPADDGTPGLEATDALPAATAEEGADATPLPGSPPEVPDASSVADAAPPRATDVSGMVVIHQLSIGGSTGASVFGFFVRGATASDAPCMRTTFPGCTVMTCGAVESAVDAGATPAIHAGPITITGGAVPAPGLAVVPSPNGYQASRDGALFAPGDILSIAAGGGDVAAFTHTVTAPHAVTMTSPVLAADPRAKVTRNAPFTVTWTSAASAGNVRLLVGTGKNVPSRSVQIACTAPATAGTLTVPAAALAMLDATVATNVIGLLSLTSSSETTFDVPASATAAGARVTVEASLGRGWSLDVE